MGLALCGGAAFAAELDSTALRWKLSDGAHIEGNVLFVDAPFGKSENRDVGASADIDFAFAAGAGFEAAVEVQGWDVRRSTVSYLGTKFQFAFLNGLIGAWEYPNAVIPCGTFPRQRIRVGMIEPAPRSRGSLFLGLQHASGRMVFDLSTLRIRSIEGAFPRTNETWRCTYDDRVLRQGASRGVMLPLRRITEDDFATLHRWGATLLRYQLNRLWGVNGANRDLADYDRWLSGELDHIEETVLPLARKYGLRVVVDLHVPPGGRDSDAGMSIFYERKYADHFVVCWRRIAERFKGRREVYGYDLVNEPFQMRLAAPGCDYWTLQ